MCILFWNICGVGNAGTINQLLYLIRRFRVNVLALVELKISGEQADRVCRRLGFTNWHRHESEGLSGGLWLFWNPIIVCIEVLSFNQ